MARHEKPNHNNEWATPDWLLKALDVEFGFTLDPCPLNPDWTEDGLTLDWNGHTVFCNPPYDKILPWVEKAYASNATTVFILPPRTDVAWFHLLLRKGAEIRWFRKRVAFIDLNGKRSQPNSGIFVAVVHNLQGELCIRKGKIEILTDAEVEERGNALPNPAPAVDSTQGEEYVV